MTSRTCTATIDTDDTRPPIECVITVGRSGRHVGPVHRSADGEEWGDPDPAAWASHDSAPEGYGPEGR